MIQEIKAGDKVPESGNVLQDEPILILRRGK